MIKLLTQYFHIYAFIGFFCTMYIIPKTLYELYFEKDADTPKEIKLEQRKENIIYAIFIFLAFASLFAYNSNHDTMQKQRLDEAREEGFEEGLRMGYDTAVSDLKEDGYFSYPY